MSIRSQHLRKYDLRILNRFAIHESLAPQKFKRIRYVKYGVIVFLYVCLLKNWWILVVSCESRTEILRFQE